MMLDFDSTFLIRRIFKMLSLFALVMSLFCTPTMSPVTTQTVVVTGDSVVLTVAYTSAAVVDSVVFTAGLGQFGSDKTVRAAKVAGGPTIARLAWPKTNWAPNQTLGSAVKVRVGRIASGCSGGACWTADVSGPNWSYFNDATPPAAPLPADIVVQSVGLN